MTTQLPANDIHAMLALVLAAGAEDARIVDAGSTSERIVSDAIVVYWDAQSGVEPGWAYRLWDDSDSLGSVDELERLVQWWVDTQEQPTAADDDDGDSYHWDNVRKGMAEEPWPRE